MAPRKTAPKEATPPRPKGSTVDNGRRGLFARPSKSIGAFVTTQPQRARATSFAGTRLDTQPKAQQTKTGGWEMLAWAMHNDVGELGYIDNLIADTVSDCALRPLRLDPATREESVDESPEAQRVHDAFTGPRGGQKELLRKAALHLQVGGETMLFGQEAVEATGVSLGVWWEFLSPFELIIDDRGHVVRKADGMSEEKIDPDTCYIARGWRSDPTFSGRADSPVRRVLQVAGEVAVLTQLVDAIAKCVDEDTEILTADGWKRHQDLQVGDEVLTLNHETGLTEWQPTLEVNRYERSDHPMMLMDRNLHSSLTTLNHRWPVLHDDGKGIAKASRRWRQSDQLSGLDRIITAAPCAEIPVEQKWSDALVEIIAWYWTEGYHRNRQVQITQSHTIYPHKVEMITRALTSLFGPPCEYMRATMLGGVIGAVPHPDPKWRAKQGADGCTVFTLNMTASAAILDIVPDKIVPLSFIRELTLSQLELFIDRSIAADGTVGAQGTIVIGQRRGEALDALEFACILAGRTTHRYMNRLRNYYPDGSDYPVHSMSIIKSKVNVPFATGKSAGGLGRRPDKPSVVNYTGTVWCPTTDNGSWMARRKGTVYFTGNSHLANGVFYVPEEMSFGPDDESEDDIDDLSDTIMSHMRAPVENRGDGASLAPLIMRGPAMLGDKPAKDLMGLIPLAEGLDTYLQGLREEALTRLAQGLNAPVEMMLGKGSVAGLGGGNVAASIDSEFATKHCVPLGELLADFITYAYYRPMLVEYEGLTPEDASLRRLECDASRITARADEAQAADSLHKDDLVSDLTRLRSNGFEESDMPDPDELKIRTALRLIIAAPLVFGPYLIKLLPGFETVDVPVPTRVSETDQIAPGGTSAPPVVPQASAVDSTPVDLFVRMSTAADAALERAMEKAATRILSKAQHKVAIRDRMTGDKVRSLALLTPADLAEIGESPVTLLDGAWDTLAVKTRGWVAEWLESCSVADADDRAFRVSLALAAKMQEFATVNLHKPVKVGRNGNRVPDALITDALAQAIGA